MNGDQANVTTLIDRTNSDPAFVMTRIIRTNRTRFNLQLCFLFVESVEHDWENCYALLWTR